ncbi:MAG: hypothetical protein JO101_04655, partial [Candidatus Eremiobacteraeota bacterium]|nr:hypothetical protein [Candidatus Eremiobacteraeota bacterium]
MLRTLRARLTLSYVAFVMALFLIVAGVLARQGLAVYARSANDAVATAASRIREISSSEPDADFAGLSTAIRQSVERPGLRILGFEQGPGMKIERPPFRAVENVRGLYVPLRRSKAGVTFPDAPQRPDDRGTFMRTMFAISGLIGIRP